ncbi:flagellin N-terminal helical domain-containing protein [Pseudoprimorskyibacter insulae]|uniref:Flagellin n=1 Tax=Pseudoprimorskyibacter insulae TaxID=1695997 RepID=A0A2R8AYU0_9RHOB|nr:flagellin [Pseudoprimorskyibacter insulae]SPF81206.1 Flagellin [Pseudoprimorskyibacter insulae]
MSSILTNNGAMVALQTLKNINGSLAQTQNEISTGKSVATAVDNSAVWAISKVMESDVQGFKAISDSLSLGQSTVAVARQASETVTDLLTQMKGKIVAAQEDNVDRTKINDDVTALKGQIDSVIAAAQFNGLNLVDGSGSGASILSSLNRDSTGTVTSSSISVTAWDMSTGGYSAKDMLSGSSTGASGDGDTVAFALDNGGGNEQIEIAENGPAFSTGDSISVTVGDQTVSYTVTADDAAATTTSDIVAVALKNQIDRLGISGLTVDYDSSTPGTLDFTNAGTVDLSVSAQFTNAGSGGLGAMAGIDVSTATGAAAALGTIESLIDRSIDAASSFGSVEGRIETQANFISSLTDSLKSGIGAMVDADMEEASARLQALQVQQQLGVQALSIANQAPQSLLSLFR